MGNEIHDECGVFGYYNPDRTRQDVSQNTYLGLFALQHRGQDSAGMAVNNGQRIFCHKDLGLVVEVFDELTLNLLSGHAAVGHVRYPSGGASQVINAQPLLIKSRCGQLALAMNGSLINGDHLRARLEEQGAIFQTLSDSEVMLALIARNLIVTPRIEDAIFMMMAEVRGAYALTLMTPEAVIGVRDPDGIRPLCIGRKDGDWILASESCAVDSVGGTVLRDVRPGELVLLDDNGMRSEHFMPEAPRADGPAGRLCGFEFVYFARPDSVLDGADVSETRINSGRLLAAEHPCDADLIIGAPDSGLMAAMGYAKELGIEYGRGLLKNVYVGRTFIQPTQLQREVAVRLKFAPLRKMVAGKRICMVDDSIVRGTTMNRIVGLLRDAGAAAVHLRIACPPVIYPCFYGVDMPTQAELSACNMTKAELIDMIGVDSLEFLSLSGLQNAMAGLRCGCCSACLDGRYPAGVPQTLAEPLRRIDLSAGGY